MDIILEVLFLFILFSTIGWFLETLYRSATSKTFVNPGFMTGITLPIYGFGGLILIMVGRIVDVMDIGYKYIVLFFLSALIMTVIEYIGGYISIKYFNTKLWDYSDMKFNYKGIICPFFTFIWGLLGVLFYVALYDKLFNITNSFLYNKYYIFMFGIFFGVFLVDLFFSLNLLNVIKKYNNYIKETLSIENLKFKMANDNKKIAIFPNFKLRGYVKNRPDEKD